MEHDIRLDQVLERNACTAQGAEQLWEYVKETWIDKNVKLGNIRPSES